MAIYKETKDYKLIHDNMLNMGDYIEDGTIDCVITDPPYELGFMGKKWDGSGIAFDVDAWRKCFNALKDGGYLLAFGGTRTFHRIACAIEDAGFEIRDTIMYIYGSGFPKSHNIGLAVDKLNGVESKVIGESSNARPNSLKENNLYQAGTVGKEFSVKQATNEWQGWGTALKPAYEPIIVARKPMKTSVAENVLKNRVGGINIDECRVATDDDIGARYDSSFQEGNSQFVSETATKSGKRMNIKKPDNINLGRFPANIIHDGSDEVVSGFPESSSNGGNADYSFGNQDNTTHLYTNIKSGNHFEDSGNASRFFYTAKASKKDRDEGLEAFDEIALKPAYEPIIVARKPMKTSVAENVLKNRVGGINIDECRVATNEDDKYDIRHYTNEDCFVNDKPKKSQFQIKEKNSLGRFPANIIHDGSEEVVKGFPETQSGNLNVGHKRGDGTGNSFMGGGGTIQKNYGGDSGSASRFFYTAKASKKDRDEGLEAFDEIEVRGGGGRAEQGYDDNDEEQQRLKESARKFGAVKSVKKNIHPTVKPTELMQYLVRLVAPKGATILDCFMGSNSTGKAVMFENRERNANYKFIGIELTDEYLPICEARIEYAINKYEYDEKLEQAKTSQLSIFDFEEEEVK